MKDAVCAIESLCDGIWKEVAETWLARPLCHLESIKDRQDAVAGLRASLQ
jgi:DNA mismatch repair protein MSH6